MNPLIQDIIDATVDGEPTKVQSSFDQLIGQKIMDALETRKREVAASMFADKEEQQIELEDNDEDSQSA